MSGSSGPVGASVLGERATSGKCAERGAAPYQERGAAPRVLQSSRRNRGLPQIDAIWTRRPG